MSHLHKSGAARPPTDLYTKQIYEHLMGLFLSCHRLNCSDRGALHDRPDPGQQAQPMQNPHISNEEIEELLKLCHSHLDQDELDRRNKLLDKLQPDENAVNIDANLEKIIQACVKAPHPPSAGLAVKPSAVQPSNTIEFDSGGHFFIGHAVELRFDAGKLAGDAPLLANGLSFGDIVALAGDFYACSTPISDGDSLKKCHFDSIADLEKVTPSQV